MTFEGPSQLSAEDVLKMQVFVQEPREGPRTLAEQVMRVILHTHFREWDFNEQVPLHNRVADFYSQRLNLAIEVDGSYHNSQRWWVAPDGYKERALRKRGFSIVRFPNREVIDTPEWVIDQLLAIVPLFTVPVIPDGPFTPVGLTTRPQRPRPTTREFVLEMESDVKPSLDAIVSRITSYRSR
jgi:very-short-patch-repair endonuclease